jgi:glutathione synthase/RimK-type ligase-like ATP-grasp enzyme
VQQKRRRNGDALTGDAALIRNAANGWVFAVNDVRFTSPEIEEKVRSYSVAAVKALGLDFGAVDIIVNKKGTEAYVLEVNTAPGIESPTVLAAYVEYIRGVRDAGAR